MLALSVPFFVALKRQREIEREREREREREKERERERERFKEGLSDLEGEQQRVIAAL